MSELTERATIFEIAERIIAGEYQTAADFVADADRIATWVLDMRDDQRIDELEVEVARLRQKGPYKYTPPSTGGRQ
jgi:hypothetical protein